MASFLVVAASRRRLPTRLALLLDLTGLRLCNLDDPDAPEYGGYIIAMEDWDDWEDEYGGAIPYLSRVLALDGTTTMLARWTAKATA